MKKLTFILLFLNITFPVFALEYKAETLQDVNQALRQFYQEEQGNRLSSFAMQSLAARIQNVFNQNIVTGDANATKKDKAERGGTRLNEGS